VLACYLPADCCQCAAATSPQFIRVNRCTASYHPWTQPCINSPDLMPLQGTVLIKNAEELQSYSQGEEDRMEQVIKGIADSYDHLCATTCCYTQASNNKAVNVAHVFVCHAQMAYTMCGNCCLYSTSVHTKETYKAQIAHLYHVQLQRRKGSCGRQCVWRDGYALHREVWHDGTQAAIQV